MINRLRGLGIVLGIIGLAFVVAGGFAFMKVQEGTDIPEGIQRGAGRRALATTKTASWSTVARSRALQAIMALLTDDWGYPVVAR